MPATDPVFVIFTDAVRVISPFETSGSVIDRSEYSKVVYERPCL